MRRVLLAVILTGCYAPEVIPGGRCGEGGACPAELTCVADRCELPGGARDGAADGLLDDADDARSTDAPIDGRTGCPPGWFEAAPLPNRYLPRMSPRSYAAARADCATAGGYLAVPGSALEIQLISGATDAAAAWVGIDDIATEGVFIAADTLAPATYLPWQPNEPDNDTTDDPAGQDCVQLFMNDDQLDDDYCTETKLYLCECTP